MAVAAVALALAACALLEPMLKDSAPLIIVFLAPIIAAFYGGLGPGLFATVAGGFLGIALFISPAGWPFPPHLAEWARLLVFFAEGALISWVIHTRSQAYTDLAREHYALTEAQVKLVARERRLRETLEAVPSAVLLVDAHGRILFANARAEQLFGYTRAELLTTSVEQLLPDEQRAVHVAERARYQQAPAVRPMGMGREFYARRRDGSTVAVEVGLSPLTDDGKPLVLAAVADITARKAAEIERERTARARAHLAAIVESTADAITSETLEEGTITFWNKGAAQLFGYEAQEMIGAPHSRLIPAERLAEEQARRRVVADMGRVEQYETEHLARDGRSFPVAITLSPIRDDAGRTIGLSRMVRDITARRRAEEALRASRKELQLVADSTSVMLAHCDRERRYLFVNRAYAAYFGHEPREMIGRTMAQHLGGAAYALAAPYTAQVLSGEHVSFEVDMPFRELGMRTMQTVYSPHCDPASAEVRGFVAAIADITERKRTEDSLRESLQRFRDLAESMPAIVWVATADGTIEYVARKALSRYAGEQSAEELERDWISIVHPDDAPRSRQQWRAALGSGEPHLAEVRLRRSDGTYRWHLARAVAVRDEDGRILKWYGSVIDIHEQKQLEQEARRLASRLETIIEGITDAFIAVDHDCRCTFLNARAVQLLKRDRTALLGRSLLDELPELRGTALETHCREAEQNRRSMRFEMSPETFGVWLDVSIFPSQEGLALYLRDVTLQHSIEEQLRQAQRLDSIGKLTGGVAHDFNNLLTVILGNASLLAEELAEDESRRSLAEQIARAAERGAALNQRLLAFARRQTLDPKVLDINQLLAGLESMLRRTLGEHIEIELVRGSGLWPALVDPVQLESALINLSINARDAMGEGGRLTIETANVRLDADYAARHVDVEHGQYVMVAVSDTGAGIAPEDLQRVFEPFFTTKEKGKGTGLGLAMVYGFIKQSGGHIKIYSEPGQGTTVRMYLPRVVGRKSTGGMAPPVEQESTGGSETILLVEDDELVRRFAREQLAWLGYRVLEADNGPRALEILRQHDDIDLLFTDVVMPGGMSGRKLADEAAALRPALRVLFTSGYTENAIVHHGRLDPGVQLIAKPYRRAALASAVRAALSRRAPDD